MKKITIVGAVASLAFALAPMPSTGAHDAEFKSTVTLHRGQSAYFGHVDSTKKACKGGRTVKVIKDFTGPRPSELVGTAISKSNGDWRLPKPFRKGYFHARVKRGVKGGYGHTHTCKGAGSGTLKIGRK
jgi:hypothetical protein